MIEWVPLDKAAVENVATPLAKTPDPRDVAPSLKATEPPGETPVTVAVKVVEADRAEGFTDEVRAVPVVSLLTTWVITAEVDVALLASPL